MRFKRESAIIAFIISVLIIAGVWNFFHVPFQNEILQVDLEKQLTVKKAINIINFNDEIKRNKKYTEFDGTHLTDKGNSALSKLINSKIGK